MNILDLFQKNSAVQTIKEQYQLPNYDLLVKNTTTNHNYLLAYLTFVEAKDFVVYIASNLYKATQAYEVLCQLVGMEDVLFYATDEIVSAELLAVSNEFRLERQHTIQAIIHQKKKIIVTHTLAVTRPLLPKAVILQYAMTLEEKQTIKRQDMVLKLIASGYKRTPITQQVGEFSVRGEVIDIFPVSETDPIRIDFFDDEIETIKSFDSQTQKTKEKKGRVFVLPINGLVYDAGQLENLKGKIPDQDYEDLLHYHQIEHCHKYIAYFSSEQVSLLDYLPQKIVLYEEIGRIKEAYEKTIVEVGAFLASKNQKMDSFLFYLPFSCLFYNVPRKIYLAEYASSLPGITLSAIINLNGYAVLDYQNDIRNLIQELSASKKTIILSTTGMERYGLLKEILIQNDIKFVETSEVTANKINLTIIENALSFAMADDLEVIHETHIFKKPSLKKAKYRSAYQHTIPIESRDDIMAGEYVVHFDYGIARYKGIKTIELQGIKNDYIVLQFENMELYVPVEKISLLEKYQGTEGSAPKLTNIGTKEWEKKKARVREKLETLAFDLVRLQAIREERKGYPYQPDEEIQTAFEQDFEFQETKDQIKTIEAIKEDMEQGKIIDRLVCGDVGYGKTEVAMRIALKTVMNGKQVAYLAPTTILSRQHYYTFKERLEKYGIKIGLLNRLVANAKQDETIRLLKQKDMDIVIGTHRLLNDEIQYRDLGLLIVDEEQRFGVLHKEKIKQYKNTINVLTLTATPIPRTLQMAIMGIRQLSLMETPPQNRYPVQTYVLEENESVIREAIYRELSRKGQVFYLHNRIFDLERVYRKIKKLVPEARILIAHGQMEKSQLEDAIQAFIDKEFDVLICTTIIETGIDIPNSNTLIVDMADRLGLAQMYQIRGRVGRSDRVSYAYFLFEENKVLTEAGTKRLNAIKEFTTLGSGYRIALRDLAIRGAGDILGEEQSGFIDSVGLDMYMRLLQEAIDKVKGMQKKEEEPFTSTIEVSKHVSSDYVEEDEIKIMIHKKISYIRTREDKEDLIEELKDRFGQLTPEIMTYINKQYLDYLLQQHQIEEMKTQEERMIIILSVQASSKMDGAKLFSRMLSSFVDVHFEYVRKKIKIYLPSKKQDTGWIEALIDVLEDWDSLQK